MGFSKASSVRVWNGRNSLKCWYTLIPYQPQNINVGDNKDSYKLVTDESNNQVNIVIITPPTDSSVKERKRVR
ncbi:hypothetical protein MTR_8g072790 [Medicago truncatula]|uniref:Uncharacterized protein n=1 Tax=Medicago truncatula TaxID=3880 RepID=G7L8L2_MEDTR|nr:hypothetical protein MTR_8g072790 [Medicago truncatula]